MVEFVLLCLGGAALTVVAAPLVLTVGRWQLLHPRAALTAWFAAFFLGTALLLAAVIGSIVGAVTASEATPHDQAILLTVAAWLGLGGIGALVAFVAVATGPMRTGREESSAVDAAIASTREERAGFTLVRFPSPQLIACLVPGRNPEILLSSAMEQALSLPQLQAVLAHEFAHLRQRHGWAIRIAELNALCLPRTRPGRTLKRATVLLIELAADDVAARQAGAANLANALSILAVATGAEAMQLRAERLTARRWPAAGRGQLPQAIRLSATA